MNDGLKSIREIAAEIVEDDVLISMIHELERECPALRDVGREELLSIMQQAEATIREQMNVINGCIKKLQRI